MVKRLTFYGRGVSRSSQQFLVDLGTLDKYKKAKLQPVTIKRLRMIKPKIPYLQYEILEYYYLKPDSSLSDYVGYPKGSKIVEGAIKSLVKKRMINDRFDLTEYGLYFVKEKIEQGYNFPDYSKVVFDADGLGFSQISGSQYNHTKPVFRWYSYLEDFPSGFIEDYIKKYKINDKYYVLDPFIGSGTTVVQAKLLGYKSIGIDINPLMTFVSRIKTNWSIDVSMLSRIVDKLVNEFKELSTEQKKMAFNTNTLKNMPRRELNQWLSPVKQFEVSAMLNLIKNLNCSEEIRNILVFITSTSAVNVSYVAFCPGTTFYPFREKPDFLTEFVNLAGKVITDLQNNEVQKSKNTESIIIEGSSKDAEVFSKYKNKVDIIITSPPYPNDLEYTRQTRLELYLNGYVKDMSDVQSIKKKMVKGSTKLIFKEDITPERVANLPNVKEITSQVAFKLKDKNWGFDYPKMINQYFADMWVAMEIYYNTLVKGGACILVVGDQTSKGVVIPVAEILAEIAKKIGFSETRIELHRNRRSSAHDIQIPEENLILIK